jgi:2-C-methyl-D-erythritol 4-phosphate cytidylyltransferase
MEQARAVVLIVAAGSGSRLDAGDGPKALLKLDGTPMLVVGLAAASMSPAISGAIIAVPPGSEDQVRSLLSSIDEPIVVVTGGATRQASVACALDAVPDDVDIVAVHDAARPFASAELFSSVVAAVVEGADAAVPVIAPVDSVKRVRDGWIVGTEPRDQLGLAQTPQASRVGVLRDAMAKAAESGLDFSDDAGLLEWAGVTVRTVAGEPGNFKITTSLDLARANQIVRSTRG